VTRDPADTSAEASSQEGSLFLASVSSTEPVTGSSGPSVSRPNALRSTPGIAATVVEPCGDLASDSTALSPCRHRVGTAAPAALLPSDPERHVKAAQALADEHFDSSKDLPRLLEAAHG
jgi:hypothetical protein